MKKTIVILTLITGTLWLTQGCYYDKEEYLYPAGNCDTTAVTYAAKVAPIFQSNCYSCHNTSSALGSVILDTHAGAALVANDGRLMGTISHSSGFSPMPQGGNKMSDCNINIIKTWVDAGAPNN
jgi:cytochrome c5